MSELAQWDSFYVIVGSAAGALIGLQFVVMTLIAESPPLRAAEAGAAFGTRAIVHFSATLLLSAILRAPWQSIGAAAALCGIIGVWGIGYSAVVLRHMRRQTAYQPDIADWAYFLVLPMLGYLLLAGSGYAILSHPREGLFGIGTAALILLFVAIHNVWDSVAYHVFVSRQRPDGER